jgi:hypothetical protein
MKIATVRTAVGEAAEVQLFDTEAGARAWVIKESGWLIEGIEKSGHRADVDWFRDGTAVAVMHCGLWTQWEIVTIEDEEGDIK